MDMESKTPVSHWIISGLSLVWNAFGAVDYTMTQSGNEAYLAQFTPEQRAYFEGFPAWMEAAWALGIWGAVAGSLLLLMRSRHAVTAFGVSLFGLLVSTIWQFGLSGADVMKIFGTGPMVMTAFIWLVAIALFLYARKKRDAGLLR
ncbi:MAG: hypothetical protein IPG54_13435 [Sphingomonadales bacterium]|jgi:hypothetical protein|nr:hypothetical protein [Sphingomonadales bacterium]MBK9004688.1 hypothetical protein [Sphingomonadales bacterium]MBK9269871.1 hypothetical protein [Sphingomonadales bacterium]MBP6433813.1 hypothetical protein [Sphingorhabdus sp.]